MLKREHLFHYSKKKILNLYTLATSNREVSVPCPDAKSYVFYRTPSQTLILHKSSENLLNEDSD